MPNYGAGVYGAGLYSGVVEGYGSGLYGGGPYGLSQAATQFASAPESYGAYPGLFTFPGASLWPGVYPRRVVGAPLPSVFPPEWVEEARQREEEELVLVLAALT